MTVRGTNIEVLQEAAHISGVDVTGAELIRDGSHAMYRLTAGVVARIGRPGTAATAEKEVKVSQWLTESGLNVTQTLPDLLQPIVVNDRPVTWWQLLPKHRAATPAELGEMLRHLHDLEIPRSLQLPHFNPFAELDVRIDRATTLNDNDRTWLMRHHADLRDQYEQLPLGEPRHAIHGDAWQGNVAVPSAGKPILLDLEHVAIGHSDWDLIPLAVDYADFARLDKEDYHSFVTAYGGHDVIETPTFDVLAKIQELRWVCFVLSKSGSNAAARREAHHRIACLRGDIPRPWTWTAF